MELDYPVIVMARTRRPAATSVENKTSRFTILIDPRKKKLFLEICAEQDLTPSQVVRQLIREYVISRSAGRELPEWLVKAASGKSARQ